MGEQGSIGAGWSNMGERSEYPSAEERAKQAAEMREPPRAVRHPVHMRFERSGSGWVATFIESGRVLRECRFKHDHTLEETVRRGLGFRNLEDKQAFAMGVAQGKGVALLALDAQQFGALLEPR